MHESIYGCRSICGCTACRLSRSILACRSDADAVQRAASWLPPPLGHRGQVSCEDDTLNGRCEDDTLNGAPRGAPRVESASTEAGRDARSRDHDGTSMGIDCLGLLLAPGPRAAMEVRGIAGGSPAEACGAFRSPFSSSPIIILIPAPTRRVGADPLRPNPQAFGFRLES